MSTHSVTVVRLGEITKHPNADSLGITKIWDYTVIIPLGEYEEGDLVAYIEPDYMVDSERPEFAFLKGKERIKARRLRGVWSQGLAVRAPEGSKEGDDVMALLGVERYVEGTFKEREVDQVTPKGFLKDIPKYDLENLRRYRTSFQDGEEVFVQEKLHGANARFCFSEGQMWAGSRNLWRTLDGDSEFAITYRSYPQIEAWCRANPDHVLYGEIIGRASMKYGHVNGHTSFFIFDVMDDKQEFWSSDKLVELNRVPTLRLAPYKFMKFNLEELAELSMTKSEVYSPHDREGIVVRPIKERRLGQRRQILKLVSDLYLSKQK